MKNKLSKISFIGIVLISVLSCTNLVEKPYVDPALADALTNSINFDSTLKPAYKSLNRYIWNYWNITENTSDELQAPTRGSDWADGGQWVRLNSHDLLPTEGLINDLWFDLFKGVSLSNTALSTLNGAPETVKEKTLFIAEARALRAFYYFLLCDTFGSVPLIPIGQIDPKNPPAQATRRQVAEFIESELKAVLPSLLEKAPSGRFDKGVANTLLAKLYINSEAWIGVAKNAEAIAAANAVINSNNYGLISNYFDNFITNNENSKEAILMAPFSNKESLGDTYNMNFYMRTLHYNQLNTSPWNGFTTISEVYDGFEKEDTRRDVMWEGPQYSNFNWPSKGTTGAVVRDRTGVPLSFSKTCPITNAGESNGIRVPKYQPDITGPAGQGENDYIIFRLADVMLVKSEALIRTGKAADALLDVNKLRARAGLKALDKIDLQGIYDERGHELFWEGFRRQDQIRFGKFTDGYTNKTAKSNTKVLLFPIPNNQLVQNPNLRQNPGY